MDTYSIGCKNISASFVFDKKSGIMLKSLVNSAAAIEVDYDKDYIKHGINP